MKLNQLFYNADKKANEKANEKANKKAHKSTALSGMNSPPFPPTLPLLHIFKGRAKGVVEVGDEIVRVFQAD